MVEAGLCDKVYAESFENAQSINYFEIEKPSSSFNNVSLKLPT